MNLPSIPPGAPIGSPARVESITEYCRFMRDVQTVIREDENQIWMVAIGMAETGLNNLAIGENWKNGTKHKIIGDDRYGFPIDAYYSLGLGWIQHDSGWLEREYVVNGVEWTLESIREDPEESLRLIAARPGFVIYDADYTQILDLSAWNAFGKAKQYVREVADIYHTLP